MFPFWSMMVKPPFPRPRVYLALNFTNMTIHSSTDRSNPLLSRISRRRRVLGSMGMMTPPGRRAMRGVIITTGRAPPAATP